ncbi:hypothetical protein ACFE04_029479 [Oxalis oulophora]
MTSKGPRSKFDHETKPKRHKALEAPREPCRPKTHWDYVLEEMVWLSKDFESERKWRLTQAKKVALKASKGMMDQATRGERKLKEEEQRLRKVALNISKDVKKFWIKIEKLVLYKHQMELDEKKKKALDKQLEFLLGQTERYSTMLAENLGDSSYKPKQENPAQQQQVVGCEEEGNDTENPSDLNGELQPLTADIDEDYDVQSEESEDDEHTIEEDEALISKTERDEELEALHNEIDLPIEELLKRYTRERGSRESSPEKEHGANPDSGSRESSSPGNDDDTKPSLVENHGNGLDLCASQTANTNNSIVRRCSESNGVLSTSRKHLVVKEKSLTKISNTYEEQAIYDFNDEKEDGDFVFSVGEEKDDETTLLEEEELAKADESNSIDEIALLQKESEVPLEELLARYRKDIKDEVSEDESGYASVSSEDVSEEKHDNYFDKQDEIRDCQQADDQEHTQPEKLSDNQEHTLSDNYFDKQDEIRDCQAADDQEHPQPEKLSDAQESDDIIADAAAAARSAQPTGNTLSTTNVRTKVPFLLKYPLREYQHIGLDWLVTMYEKRLNGILADEMGLGKTIMTIALLAHLACEKGIWGPHLIVVPTSVMLNWETEFLKWCPAFKILTYFGSAKERKLKRQGWMKPNSFHICITTYRLVIQDSKVFKRKKWKYLILDEAHLIKNWKSQRWQTLLNFNSKRRILLTGTPLQNDLMELWSLMHFLMPHIFQSHQEFKDWFSNPITGMVEGQEKVNKEVVDRLHNVLRPFLLRRLKKDVETQLPSKSEHVIYCRLSKRQRNLYEDFIASSETQATLASTNFFGMISIIMQLRKVCNHPDLFEGRPIVSSFDMSGIDIQLSSSICSVLPSSPFSTVDLKGLGFLFTHLDFSMNSWECDEVKAIATPPSLIEERANRENLEEIGPFSEIRKQLSGTNILEEVRKTLLMERVKEAKKWAASVAWWNSLRCKKKPMYSTTLRELLTLKFPVDNIGHEESGIVLSPVERFKTTANLVESFMFAIPAARAPPPVCWCSKTGSSVFLDPTYKEKCSEVVLPLLTPLRPAIVRRQVYFPDRRLIQFDCGKLQQLAILLRRLKSEGHRALIFTQMTKMLDILEVFINLYGYTYMRLDGSTQPEERQTLMQRFNTNPKYFLFILSTRSGGVGINLVGADTVIFYDSDWNPAMDQQAQDRCHRIGQTREVHIYRLISESTIEENILKKAKQKRALDDLVIQSGSYNTEFFKKLDPIELFSGHQNPTMKNTQKEKSCSNANEVSVSNADVEAALKLAEDEADYIALERVEQEEAMDNQEFTEDAIGKLEDEEFANEDDLKTNEPADPNGCMVTPLNKDNKMIIPRNTPNEERALTISCREDNNADILADVKQMAEAAVAAGQAISSFENQLRPIDRYAIRFLEMWDPIVDKASMESEKRYDKNEWELDRIEKYKEEMEAEMDEGEEPLIYERWDADFATEAYQQEVEALAQQQLLDDLEAEAKQKEEDEYNANQIAITPKPKSKKKPKKPKFKSLKKGSLDSDTKRARRESTFEPMYMDDDEDDDDSLLNEEISSDTVSLSPSVSLQKKRKKADLVIDSEEVKSSKKKSKKPKNNLSEVSSEILQTCNRVNVEAEQKTPLRSKVVGKFSIPAPLVRRVLMIKPEKLKKGNIWSKECVPVPDCWAPEEDAILCAVVHEYGSNWSLVSETLYGMTAGGKYRGRFRHPVFCCERFRELIQRHVMSAPEGHNNNEKNINAGSGKALLKVTEDNTRMLVKTISEQLDNERLLQKHFTAILSSIWRVRSKNNHNQNLSSNGLYFRGEVSNSARQTSKYPLKQPAQSLKFSTSHRNLLPAAIEKAYLVRREEPMSNRKEKVQVFAEKLDLTLDLPQDSDDLIQLPCTVNLSIYGADNVTVVNNANVEDRHLKVTQSVVEDRFRNVAREFDEDFLGWASSAFPANSIKSRSALKTQTLGKHKPSHPDPIKSPKLKIKRTSMEQNPGPVLTVSLSDPNLKFELMPGTSHDDCWTDELDKLQPCFDTDHSLAGDFETIKYNYDPGLISDLIDVSTLPDEFIDIG